MRFLLLFLLVTGFFQISLASDSLKCKIVFYREYSYQGSSTTNNVYVNDFFVVGLRNNSFFNYECLPGDCKIQIDRLKSTKLQLKLEEGKTYYLKFNRKVGLLLSTLELILVDSAIAYPAIASGLMRDLGIDAITMTPKKRLGIMVGQGKGFECTTISNNSKNSKFSFGGGRIYGLKYGYEIDKYVDLAFGASFQSSTLDPKIDSAKMSFDRMIVSLTPSFIVPIGSGNTFRFKLGGGADFYTENKLKMEFDLRSAKVLDILKYKESIGFHLNLNFEYFILEHFSLNCGLKYYRVNYQLKSRDILYPVGNSLDKPNGNGIDLNLGLFCYF